MKSRMGLGWRFLPCLPLLPLLGSAQQASLPWLSTSGTNIVDSTGRTVILQGFNAGGAYLAEPWMSGIKQQPPPGLPEIRDEDTLWKLLSLRFGPEAVEKLQRAWRTAWLGPEDIGRLAALGLNAVRIPFFYRLLEDDSRPGILKPEGLALLDEVLAACRRYGVYAILDLHGAPGGQSDVFTTGQEGLNQLFRDPAYQERTVRLWAAIAERYRDSSEVAGYDLLNEPFGAPSADALVALHDRIYRAIRAVDSRHIIFIEDGAKGIIAFPQLTAMGWRNVCYSIHIYFPDAVTPEPHRRYLESDLPLIRAAQQLLKAPVYVGEFSTLIEAQGGSAMMAQYIRRFAEYGWSWSAWNHKFIDAVDGRNNIIGLYTNTQPWDGPEPYRDSLEQLEAKFARYDTSRLEIQGELARVILAATPAAPRVSTVEDAAAFRPVIAPAAWIGIRGGKLALTTRTWTEADFRGSQLPVELDGTSVRVNGKPAYLSFISPGQVNALVPDDIGEGEVEVRVATPRGTSASVVYAARLAPALFVSAPPYAAAVYSDGTYVAPAGFFPGVPARPARPGDVIALFGTSCGPTDPPWSAAQVVPRPLPLAGSAAVRIGGRAAEVTFAGVISPGVCQFNVAVPDLPPGDASLTLEIQGVRAQDGVAVPIAR